MELKLPITLRCGPFDINVIDWTPLEASGAQRRGEYAPFENIIRIRSDMPDSVKKETLMHEILHVAFLLSDLGNSNHEEVIVSSLAPWMMTFFQDNPILGDIFKR